MCCWINFVSKSKKCIHIVYYCVVNTGGYQWHTYNHHQRSYGLKPMEGERNVTSISAMIAEESMNIDSLGTQLR